MIVRWVHKYAPEIENDYVGIGADRNRQVRQNDQFLSVVKAQRQSSQTIPRQGIEWLEGLGELNRAMSRYLTEVRRRTHH